MTRIKAVIFDMNGVIINDKHIHKIALNKTLKPYRISLNDEGYLKCCAGKTDRAGFEFIAKKFKKKLPIDKLIKQKGQIYLKLFLTNKKACPGIIKLIHLLAKNFTLAVASSALRQEVDLTIQEFGIKQDFEITISANEVTKGKPDPEPYLITAQKLGLKPEECVVIEDSKSGVISAKRAGCYCIGITTTHSKKDLAQADLIVNQFSAINTRVIQGLVST